MNLTKNFKLSEFGKESGFSAYQMSLVLILAENLQKVRDFVNSLDLSIRVDKTKPIGMLITSGLRTQEDYNKLVAKGYNPSKTSDHYFGVSVNGFPTLGAADIQFTNFKGDYNKIYEQLVFAESNKFEFGQIILEFNPQNKKYWIHFGNSPKLIFSQCVYESVNRTKFLISKDNGKTYKPYTK